MIVVDPTNRVGGTAESDPPDAPAAPGDGKGPAAVQHLLDDLAALGDQAVLYLAARLDQLKLSVRRAIVYSVIGILGLLIGGAVLITSAVMIVAGIARGLGELFGQRLWLGELVTGLSILALVALASYLLVLNITRTSRWKTIHRYAELHKQQRNRRRPIAPESNAESVGK